VLAVASFSSDEDVVHMANDSECGLAASVWTRDSARGERIVRRLVAGTVMLSATAATYVVSALALRQPVLPAQIPGGAWFGLVAIGVVSTFIAVLAFYGGAHRIGAARAAIVSTVEPIWTIVLAGLLFAAKLGPLQLAGGALILLGVVIAQTGAGAGSSAGELRIADE
jgi:drug/metabolite transporter (DMT)-like permease